MPKDNLDKTPVIFRKWPKSEGGDVIAIFPTLPGINDPYTCESYQHIGQHGACDPQIVKDTLPALDVDYIPLKTELEGIGYNLRIIKRLQARHLEIRKQQLAFEDKIYKLIPVMSDMIYLDQLAKQ